MVRLGDVCEFYTGTGFPQMYQGKSEGMYPFYKVGDISKNFLLEHKFLKVCDNYVDIDTVNKIKGKLLPKNTVVFAKIGEAIKLNRRAITNIECLVDNNVMGIKPNEEVIDIDYFYYFMCNLKMETLAEATTLPSVKKSALENVVVVFPNIKRQRSIALRIDKLNILIAKRKQQLQKLDELVKARFVEMFGDIKNPKYRKESIGSVAKLQGGYAFKSSDFVDDGIALVQISNVNKDYLNWEDANKLPASYKEKYSAFLLKEGDLLLAMTRPIIKSLNAVKVAKVSKNDLPCLLNQRVGRFVCSDKLNPIYLEIVCKTDDFKDYVEKMSGNSLQPNVSSRQVEEYEMIIPPVVLQNKFADFVQQIDKSKLHVQKSLDKLEILKKALMQKYFG